MHTAATRFPLTTKINFNSPSQLTYHFFHYMPHTAPMTSLCPPQSRHSLTLLAQPAVIISHSIAAISLPLYVPQPPHAHHLQDSQQSHYQTHHIRNMTGGHNIAIVTLTTDHTVTTSTCPASHNTPVATIRTKTTSPLTYRTTTAQPRPYD